MESPQQDVPEIEDTNPPETALLNPAPLESNHDAQPPQYHDEENGDEMVEMNTRKLPKDPLYIFIFYTLSIAVSAAGLGCAIWGYFITINGPLDEQSKKQHREGYETVFFGMQSVIVLLSVNIAWSSFNLFWARKGMQQILCYLNMIYDFLIWATLIAFCVMNMLEMLWDRRLCDGWDDKEMYDKCDVVMLHLLVVEMVSVNLGLLVAVLHFILLIGNCCTCVDRHNAFRSHIIKQSIKEEEQMLLVLMNKRRKLVQQNLRLEERVLVGQRPLPSVPDDTDTLVDGIDNAELTQHGERFADEEDLIDMIDEEQTQ